MEILARRVRALTTTSVSVRRSITLSDALAELALREKYLALEEHAQRFDVGVKYGFAHGPACSGPLGARSRRCVGEAR